MHHRVWDHHAVALRLVIRAVPADAHVTRLAACLLAASECGLPGTGGLLVGDDSVHLVHVHCSVEAVWQVAEMEVPFCTVQLVVEQVWRLVKQVNVDGDAAQAQGYGWRCARTVLAWLQLAEMAEMCVPVSV